MLSGEVAFKLYDTYGFPLDLTADVCRERDIAIDEAGFEREMEAQQLTCTICKPIRHWITTMLFV